MRVDKREGVVIIINPEEGNGVWQAKLVRRWRERDEGERPGWMLDGGWRGWLVERGGAKKKK